eukprot:gene17311-23619_t
MSSADAPHLLPAFLQQEAWMKKIDEVIAAMKKKEEPSMPYPDFFQGLGAVPNNEHGGCHAINVKGDGFCANTITNGGGRVEFEDGTIMQFCCRRDTHWFFKNPQLLTASRLNKMKAVLKGHEAQRKLLARTSSIVTRSRARARESDADGIGAATSSPPS